MHTRRLRFNALKWHIKVEEMLPTPVRVEISADNPLVLVGGTPGEVAVAIAPESITVSIYSRHWTNPHTSTLVPEPLAILYPVPAREQKQLEALLKQMIDTASEIRRSRYRTCPICHKFTPPEWLQFDDVCQSCAESLLGIVH